ncbi:MAG: DUF1801 domain-containing protein [Gammaproteobacteria bacterium]|nr:DUF1801 domain-containing protein [Gammaproteobacteria bacterium]MBT3860316.1 DUF1801 domain-containing protein [Gammaproteobacteria bacterium]MBT3987608.1 DUF1801 domain-containing protein [Gammaproteobacteria bacterium]MBT4256842.1 DUF1801 domain-containing protein [Gammaproteobacteria bacterium]MBT4582228.1 DUF1801 domain-containing protein [Gammaproteobacteria bacterium]
MQFDRDLASPKSDLFCEVRDILLAFSEVSETKKEKITTYSYNGSGLCHMRTMPYGVDIGFLKGAFIEDKYGMLHGETKRMRVLSLEKMQEQELRSYIAAAIELNK